MYSPLILSVSPDIISIYAVWYLNCLILPSIGQLVEGRTVDVKLLSLGACSNSARRNHFLSLT